MSQEHDDPSQKEDDRSPLKKLEELEEELADRTENLPDYYKGPGKQGCVFNECFCKNSEFMNQLMFWYKVEQCEAERAKKCNLFMAIETNCLNGHKGGKRIDCGCFDSHIFNCLERRQPYYNCKSRKWDYINEMCPQWRVEGNNLGSKDIKKCRDGDNCGFCHSTLEMIYHPLEYKRHKCRLIRNANDVCGNGLLCWNYHSNEDRRYGNDKEIEGTFEDIWNRFGKIRPNEKDNSYFIDWMTDLTDFHQCQQEIGILKQTKNNTNNNEKNNYTCCCFTIIIITSSNKF